MQVVNQPESPNSNNDPNKKKTNINKRSKASVACQECRKRKVKCEGVDPCERCRKSGLHCVFPQQQNAKRNQPKQYIDLLETRLRNMERTLESVFGMSNSSIKNMVDGTLDSNSVQDRNGIHEDDTTIQQPNEFHAQSINRLQDPYTLNEIGQPYYTQDTYRQPHSSSFPSHRHHQQPSYYTNSRPITLHRQPSDISLSTNNDTLIQSEPTTPTPSHQQQLTDIDHSLIELYFEKVHPYLPMIHKVMFKRQLTEFNNNETPPLFLIYSMCALASKWSSPQYNQSLSSSEPPGFSYYRRAYAFIDESMVAPRVTTIQALILLAKYQEQYKRLGSFYRTDQYLTIATEMCFQLNLHDLPSSSSSLHHIDHQDMESKKRTFWVTFLYDLWLSIENGHKPRFDITLCTTDYPSSHTNEGPHMDDIISKNNMVIRLGRIISEIYDFSRLLAERRQEQGSVRTEQQQIEEQGKIFTLQTTLESYLRDITSIPHFDYLPSNYILHQMDQPLQNNKTITITTNNNKNNKNSSSNINDNNNNINGSIVIKYPMDQVSVKKPFVGFLHMMYHYAIILLHLHPTLFPSNKPISNIPPYQHQQLCALSASIINGITESIIDTHPIDNFYYPIRGVQLTILCSTTALSVHRFEMKTSQDELRKNHAENLYQHMLTIIHKLSNETSAIELQFLAKDADLAEMYNKLAVDTNTHHDIKNIGGERGLYNNNNNTITTTNNNNNNTNNMNINDNNPPSAMNSPTSTITMNNDNSSTSSSPLLSPSHVSTSSTSSSVVDNKIHRPMKTISKSKRNNLTNGNTNVKRFSSPTFSSDPFYLNHPQQQQQQQPMPYIPTHLQQQQQQQQQHIPSSSSSVLSASSTNTTTTTTTTTPIHTSVLFNSSASITDPNRLEHMMQSGKFPMTTFNHHQQPIQIPHHHHHQQQPYQHHPSSHMINNNINSNTLKRLPRSQAIPYSQSTDDLRSLNLRHKNRAGYSRSAMTEDPPRLKKQRSMKLQPTFSSTGHLPTASSPTTSTTLLSSTPLQQQYHPPNTSSQLSIPPTTHLQQQQSPSPQSSINSFQNKPILTYQQQQSMMYHSSFNNNVNNSNTFAMNHPPPTSSTSSINYSMVSPTSTTSPSPVSSMPRRHTISLASGLESTGMIPGGIPMDYSLQSPPTMISMDTNQLEYHRPLPPSQQQLSSTMNHHHHNNMMSITNTPNSFYSPVDDSMMMESDMQPFINNSMMTMNNHIDMDRKMEGHALQ